MQRNNPMAMAAAAHKGNQRHIVALGQVLEHIPGLDLGAAVGWVGEHLGQQKNPHLGPPQLADQVPEGYHLPAVAPSAHRTQHAVHNSLCGGGTQYQRH